MAKRQTHPHADLATALLGFYLSASTQHLTLEEEHDALSKVIEVWKHDPAFPFGSILDLWCTPQDTGFTVKVTERIDEDGKRMCDPRALPLMGTMTLFGGWVYVDQTTSTVRQKDGRRLLDYIYLEPCHEPLGRVLADAGDMQKVTLGDNHRDLRRVNLRIVGDSPRTKSNARDKATEAAIEQYRKAAAKGLTLGLTEAMYRGTIRAAFALYDQGTTMLKAAAAE